MSKITSIISCKGGVGKTTTTVNISSYIHTQGKRVLAVDLDYQHNLSKHFGIFPGHLKDKPKRIWIAWAVINGIGAFIAYIVPLFDGYAVLP